MTEYETNILNRIGKLVMEGKLSSDFLVKNIKQSGMLLNIQTISDYAHSNKISYQGAMKRTKDRNIISLFNTKYVIEVN